MTITPYYNSDEVHLQDIYHVLGMKKDLLFVTQLISTDYYILFGPYNGKIYQDYKQDCDCYLDHDREPRQ